MSPISIQTRFASINTPTPKAKPAAPTANPLRFGNDIADEIRLQNQQALRKKQLAVLQTDYGEGITGREVLELIVELWEPISAEVDQHNREVQKEYETDLMQYEQKNWLAKRVTQKPPEYKYNARKKAKQIYEDEVLRLYSGTTERKQAAQAAIKALDASGLIYRDTDSSRRYSSSFGSSYFLVTRDLDQAKSLLAEVNAQEKKQPEEPPELPDLSKLDDNRWGKQPPPPREPDTSI